MLVRDYINFKMAFTRPKCILHERPVQDNTYSLTEYKLPKITQKDDCIEFHIKPNTCFVMTNDSPLLIHAEIELSEDSPIEPIIRMNMYIIQFFFFWPAQ